MAGEGFAQLDTAWGNFQATLGESLAPFLDARAKDIASFLDNATQQLSDFGDSQDFRSKLKGTSAELSLFNQTDPGAISDILKFEIDNTKRALDEAIAEYQKKASNAAAEIASIYASTPGLTKGQAGEIFQSELTTITGDAASLRTQLETLQSAFDGLNVSIAETKAVSSNLGALTDAIKPDVACPSAALALQNELQAMLSLYKDAQASFAAANAQGNTEAAAVAEGYVSRLVPAIREVVSEYNVLAKELGTRSIEGVFIGTGEVVYQTVEALEAQKQAAENAATAIDLLAQSGDKLGGLYDTLLDSGNIDGAASAFESIKGTMQGIVEEWLAQGKSIEEINDSLLPKLISELDGLIGAQIEAGDAGITAGELIGSGFLSSIPGISAVISAVAALTGNVLAAGNALGAVQGFTLTNWQWKDF